MEIGLPRKVHEIEVVPGFEPVPGVMPEFEPVLEPEPEPAGVPA